MRRDYLVTALCLLALVLSVQARAEVRALTDRHGEYKMTRVLLDIRSGSVWSPTRRGDPDGVLNASGGVNGDLYPVIRENAVAPNYPWVVWSRFNDVRYDLAWSRWVDGGWEPVRWIDPGVEPFAHSLDADLTFDDVGRPYVVWWRNEDPAGRVYVSLFLANAWMQAYPVSEPGVDSRYPKIEVPEPGFMIVRYETPEGTVEQEVMFDGPVTITDDINPLDYIHTGAISVVSE